MQFIGKDGSSLVINENFSLVSKDISPIKEIIQRKDFSDYIFVDNKTISMSEVTQIQVNVVDVGVMIFVFEKEDFNKEEFIEKVAKLKELSMTSFYEVLNKIKSLYQVVEPFNPLFVIYCPNGKYKIYDSCFETIYSNIKTLYVSSDANNVVVDKTKEDLSKYHEQASKGKKQEKEKFKFTNPFPIIAKDKYHFLFALVATFLIGFTSSIGIYDAYVGKMICVFFFICALAGSFLNFMIYKDTFKSHAFNSFYSLLTLIASVLGVGLSVGAYYIFKSLSKDVLEKLPNIMLIIGIVVAIYLVSASMPLLVSYIKKKKK